MCNVTMYVYCLPTYTDTVDSQQSTIMDKEYNKLSYTTTLYYIWSSLQRKSHLLFPRIGIAPPQSKFPHVCVCERFIYSQDRSQTHECNNKLGLWPRNSLIENICFEFSVCVLAVFFMHTFKLRITECLPKIYLNASTTQFNSHKEFIHLLRSCCSHTGSLWWPRRDLKKLNKIYLFASILFLKFRIKWLSKFLDIPPTKFASSLKLDRNLILNRYSDYRPKGQHSCMRLLGAVSEWILFVFFECAEYDHWPTYMNPSGWDLAEMCMRSNRVVDEILPCGWDLAECWMRSCRVVDEI